MCYFLRAHADYRLSLRQIKQVDAFILFEWVEHRRLGFILNSYFRFKSEHTFRLYDFLLLQLTVPFFTDCWPWKPLQSCHTAFLLFPCCNVLWCWVNLRFELKRSLCSSYFFCLPFIFNSDLKFFPCLFCGSKVDPDSIQVFVGEEQITLGVKIAYAAFV
jgi:hypothetical protein